MSLNSLWRIEGNPPQVQISTCSTVKWWPQMQWDGRWEGRQPYRRQWASQKAPLWRANPCSAMGRVASQLDAPFSFETCIALFMLLGSLSSSSAAAAESSCFIASFLTLSCSALASWWYVCDCSTMRETRGDVMLTEDWWWDLLFLVGLMIPRPPCRTGSAIKSLISSFSGLWPVRDGRNLSYHILQRLELIIDVGGGSGEISPFVFQPMSECSICCMWLSDSNRWQVLNFIDPFG